jgi:2-polyprenyl-3-methyl-5-hydroxy-6-metoxy-1,4-benzoquinol methylase
MASQELPGAGADVKGVDAVRIHNFELICKIIKDRYQQCLTILDVGSSNGLFLKVANKNGFSAAGLEPDIKKCQKSRVQGLEVYEGFFPNAESILNKKFDIIIFNDSFEHIPNPLEVIGGIKRHLVPDKGIVIVNLPSSEGLIFKISSMLAEFGMRSPFDRLWQKGFSSPHLHYFNQSNLQQLFKKITLLWIIIPRSVITPRADFGREFHVTPPLLQNLC